MEEDFHALITPDQIRQFETNNAARDALCLLGQLWGAQNIQITQARNTSIRHFLLIEISNPKKILDKVRGMWRFPSSTQSEPVNLPDEQETLEQRVERSLDVDKNRPCEIQAKTTEASDVRYLFSSLELDRLRAMFKEMITTSVPISKPRVKEILQKEDGAKYLLQKSSLETIINRVKYEGRLERAFKTAQN